MTLLTLLIGVLATYRITKLLLEDAILDDFRDKFWEKWPPETTKVGYLLTCPHCLSVWVALVVTVILVFCGILGLIFTLIFAFSGAVSLIYTLLDR